MRAQDLYALAPASTNHLGRLAGPCIWVLVGSAALAADHAHAHAHAHAHSRARTHSHTQSRTHTHTHTRALGKLVHFDSGKVSKAGSLELAAVVVYRYSQWVTKHVLGSFGLIYQ